MTATLVPSIDTRLECVRCQGGSGSDCDRAPYLAPDTVFCDEACITWTTMLAASEYAVYRHRSSLIDLACIGVAPPAV